MLTRPRASGFTLIELLVVIAIIAVLAALLFPTFEAAKQNANTGKCQAHQKELLEALMMYTDDYGGKLPWMQFLTYHNFEGGLGKYPWVYEVRLYQPYVKNFDILICPTKRQGYAYNEILCGPLAKRYATIPGVYGKRCECYYISGRGARLLSDIKRAGRTAAFFCAFRFHPAPGDLGPNGWGFQPEDAGNRMRILNQHNDGINYAFLDGHSKWLRPAGNGVLIATEGIDWDGNGTIGDSYVMR